MIPNETPIGARVRVYNVQGDESSAWTGVTVTTVLDGIVRIRHEQSDQVIQMSISHVEPIGARPFISHKVTCPNCQHEFDR